MCLALRFGNIFSFTVVIFLLLLFVLLLLMIFVGVIRKIRFERQESKKESLLLKMQEERERETLENEFYRLKTEYENGIITAEEYADAKRNILKTKHIK